MTLQAVEKDEICRCGHDKRFHGFSHYKGTPVAQGHGKCRICSCKKFTSAGEAETEKKEKCPDFNPETCTTKRDAMACAAEHKNMLCPVIDVSAMGDD